MARHLAPLLDAKPVWVRRAEAELRARTAADRGVRRRWVAAVVVGWQFAESVLPLEQVRPVRRLLLAMVVLDSVATYVWVSTGLAVEGNPIVGAAMVVYGDALGLVLRTVWSATLVLALTWLAQRHVVARVSLVLVLVPLGAVTLVHAAALGWVWSGLLGA
jgi:hypothetical protein